MRFSVMMRLSIVRTLVLSCAMVAVRTRTRPNPAITAVALTLGPLLAQSPQSKGTVKVIVPQKGPAWPTTESHLFNPRSNGLFSEVPVIKGARSYTSDGLRHSELF